MHAAPTTTTSVVLLLLLRDGGWALPLLENRLVRSGCSWVVSNQRLCLVMIRVSLLSSLRPRVATCWVLFLLIGVV